MIPKVGSTRIRIGIAIANGALVDREQHQLVSNTPSWKYAKAELRDIAAAEYKFAIVRNPLERLSSAFLDKALGRGSDVPKFLDSVEFKGEVRNLSFRKFVELVSENNHSKSNIHWLPQVRFLVYSNYDDLVPLEHLNDYVDRISARSGIPIPDQLLVGRHENARYERISDDIFADRTVSELQTLRGEGKTPAHQSMYDSSMEDAVRHAYKSDFAIYDRAKELVGSVLHSDPPSSFSIRKGVSHLRRALFRGTVHT